ncbi:hypothetical protein SVA_1075 [Sulfurifustis variabilis]|uniref:Antitoxin Xre/MbcA/ParS-like toxin-binding domain-containing protein n=1 Tax=Sulfurifustis variabilis TaxID=1675686 RepID=A0A1B4V8C4_9GAMM|nr:antitoxin Xre/MbcA/ParS toxin-binding domain-containing protein [Sulfurifustis variabilis]BAU47654.1 hypothetical protein SVA_1075 [Sulfurifustis variabilis]
MQSLNPEDRLQLARMIVNLLDEWGVEPAGQVLLLGLPEETKPRSMARYGRDLPLPEDAEVMERVEHLVGIADALRTTFPRNARMGTLWLNQRNNRFNDRVPLDVMLEDGLAGVIAVRAHLDCAFDWDMSGSKA